MPQRSRVQSQSRFHFLLRSLVLRLGTMTHLLNSFSFPTRSLTEIAGSVMILTVRRELRSIDKWAIVSLSGASMIVAKIVDAEGGVLAHQLASKFGDLQLSLDHPIGVGVERLSAFRGERAT